MWKNTCALKLYKLNAIRKSQIKPGLTINIQFTLCAMLHSHCTALCCIYMTQLLSDILKKTNLFQQAMINYLIYSLQIYAAESFALD